MLGGFSPDSLSIGLDKQFSYIETMWNELPYLMTSYFTALFFLLVGGMGLIRMNAIYLAVLIMYIVVFLSLNADLKNQKSLSNTCTDFTYSCSSFNKTEITQ